jgi:hypothetical protein
MMALEIDELHEPLFQTIGTFLKALFHWRDFAKKAKINIQNLNMEVFLEFFNRQN